MRTNLDTLRSEIQQFLDSRGIAVFYGVPRGGEDIPVVYWDTQHKPDFRDFLSAAQSAGVRIVTMYTNEFNEQLIDSALDRMEDSSLTREERRAIEQRLREMRAYAGFICQIELSFDVPPRVYVFDLRTDWFQDFDDLLDRIDDAYDDGGDDEPLGGGYYSKN
jgi:hypothetical protein